jgi:hypothetical protein
MKRTVILLVLGSCYLWCAGQISSKAMPVRFTSILQAGLLDGAANTAFQMQTINGIRYKTWMTGIGVGLDYYKVRGIPLFLDLRKNILERKETPFLYGDIGMHFSWVKNSQDYVWTKTTYSNGLFYELGGGYKFSLPRERGITLSAGYSVKTVSQKNYGIGACPFFGPCPEVIYEKYDYIFRRLSIKAGFIF